MLLLLLMLLPLPPPLQTVSRAVLRRQLKHVLFTEPEVITAGQKVKVYYCPDTTPLAGRQQLFITAGFNRWNHRKNFAGVAMEPPGLQGQHWHATFKVKKRGDWKKLCL
jgi:starch synthase